MFRGCVLEEANVKGMSAQRNDLLIKKEGKDSVCLKDMIRKRQV